MDPWARVKTVSLRLGPGSAGEPKGPGKGCERGGPGVWVPRPRCSGDMSKDGEKEANSASRNSSANRRRVLCFLP